MRDPAWLPLILFLHRVTPNVPDFLFHAAPVMRGTAFKARFHIVFQMAHNELGHSQLVI
jgi:hypothetical protein